MIFFFLQKTNHKIIRRAAYDGWPIFAVKGSKYEEQAKRAANHQHLRQHIQICWIQINFNCSSSVLSVQVWTEPWGIMFVVTGSTSKWIYGAYPSNGLNPFFVAVGIIGAEQIQSLWLRVDFKGVFVSEDKKSEKIKVNSGWLDKKERKKKSNSVFIPVCLRKHLVHVTHVFQARQQPNWLFLKPSVLHWGWSSCRSHNSWRRRRSACTNGGWTLRGETRKNLNLNYENHSSTICVFRVF